MLKTLFGEQYKEKILREFRVEPKKPKSTWKYNFLLISIGRLFSIHFLYYQAKRFLYKFSQAFLGGMGNSYCCTNFSSGTNRCIFINVCGKWIVLSFKYSNIQKESLIKYSGDMNTRLIQYSTGKSVSEC